MLSYRMTLTPDDDGSLLVTSGDLPELTTFGVNRDEAVAMARGALAEAIAARLKRFEPVPRPAADGVEVDLDTQTAMKVLLYWALIEAGETRAGLARRLGWARPQVDRLFDANHATRLDQFDAAFAALGRRARVVLEAA